MKAISPIRTDADHAAALAEVRRLWGATPGTAAGDRLDVLLVLIDDYETKQHAVDLPDPIAAIIDRMDMVGISRVELGRMLGVPSGRVSELLNRRRRLTVEMMRVLAQELGLPAACLLRPYELVPSSRVAA